MSNSLKNKIKINTKNIILIIFISIVTFLILQTTYAYLDLGAEPNDTTGVAGCFEVEYEAQEITAANLESSIDYSTTEAQTEVKLSKSENCKIYSEADIKIYTNDSTSAPIDNPQALKYKIVRTSGNGTIKTSDEGIISEKGETTLATVSLTETETVYKIYLWIDAEISQGSYDQETFSGYIYAESVQTSTIEE